MNSLSRREFLALAGVAVSSFPWHEALAKRHGILVNDVHSQLNETQVSEIVYPRTVVDLRGIVDRTSKAKKALSVCGSRHAAGGQQFLSNNVLVDTTKFARVLNFDSDLGLITVESGIRWVELQAWMESHQSHSVKLWAFNQKQTGLSELTIGGTIGANAHGHGLALRPFIGDIESLRLLNAEGEILNCSRNKNARLFSLVVGGYGLFGIVLDVTLKLVSRQKVRRLVSIIPVSEIGTALDAAIKRGFRYGHCQLNIDETSPEYLANGIFCSYEPVDNSTALASTAYIAGDKWVDMLELAHKNKTQAFSNYSKFFASTNGFVNWADVWQNSFYAANYHQIVDQRLLAPAASEVLSEFYVPIDQLPIFVAKARQYFKSFDINIIFSTVRFIQRDDESFLPWARQNYACVIFNLHTVHSQTSIKKTMDALSFLTDCAIAASGSFYLTYQHVAGRQQILSCYPRFEEFLAAKLEFDSAAVFQSDWYRWHLQLFA